MISRSGWSSLGASLAGILLGVVLLNYLVLVVALALFVFLASEVIIFHLGAPTLVPSDFRVERSTAFRRVLLNSDAPQEIRITYRGPWPFWGEAYDTLPSSFRVTRGSSSRARWWIAGSGETIAYQTRVRPRGSQVIGPPVVVAHGPLGLCFAEAVLPFERPIIVTPQSPVLNPGPAALALYTKVRGRLAIRHRGYGTEFRSLRLYQPSDDIRHIAWRRSTPEQLLVREFEQESRQDYLLVLDASSAMLAGTEGATALDRAVEAGVIVAGFVSRNAEDRVGLMTYAGGTSQFIRPGRGGRHFRRLNDNLALAGTRPGPFELSKVLEQLAGRLKVHTHVLLFSTLAEPLGNLGPAHIRFASKGHHLYLFAANPAGFGPTAKDPESSGVVGWAQRVEHGRLQRQLSQLHAEGIPTFTYDQRGASQKVLTAYAEIRAWGRMV